MFDPRSVITRALNKCHGQSIPEQADFIATYLEIAMDLEGLALVPFLTAPKNQPEDSRAIQAAPVVTNVLTQDVELPSRVTDDSDDGNTLHWGREELTTEIGKHVKPLMEFTVEGKKLTLNTQTKYDDVSKSATVYFFPPGSPWSDGFPVVFSGYAKTLDVAGKVSKLISDLVQRLKRQ